MPNLIDSIVADSEPTKADLVTHAEALGARLADLAEEALVDFVPDRARGAIGTGQGRAGAVAEKNPILELWKLISPQLPGVSIDQFFGFDPIDRLGYEKWPTFLAVSACCMAFNFLGYRPDKGLNSIDGVAASASDASHIGYAAFCDALISADRRLCAKAIAIYRYRSIATVVGRFMVPTKKSES